MTLLQIKTLTSIPLIMIIFLEGNKNKHDHVQLHPFKKLSWSW